MGFLISSLLGAAVTGLIFASARQLFRKPKNYPVHPAEATMGVDTFGVVFFTFAALMTVTGAMAIGLVTRWAYGISGGSLAVFSSCLLAAIVILWVPIALTSGGAYSLAGGRPRGPVAFTICAWILTAVSAAAVVIVSGPWR